MLSKAQNPVAQAALLSSVSPWAPAQQDTGRLGQGCTSMGSISWAEPTLEKKTSRLETQQIHPLFTEVSNFYLSQDTKETEI